MPRRKSQKSQISNFKFQHLLLLNLGSCYFEFWFLLFGFGSCYLDLVLAIWILILVIWILVIVI